MSFDTRLKGKITQGLFQTLLEDVKYRVVSLGIEEVIREVQTLQSEEYLMIRAGDRHGSNTEFLLVPLLFSVRFDR